MPPRLDPDSVTARVQIVAPPPWIERVDTWRGKQKPIPSRSEAIRALVQRGLEAELPTKRVSRKTA